MRDNKKSVVYIPGIIILVLGLVVLIAYGTMMSPTLSKTTMASYNVAQNKLLPIYCVETDKKVVALSFDAAWGNEDLRDILKILDKNDVKATFFMTGGWVESYPEDVKAIKEAGHDLANHSENHKQMSTLSKSECAQEIRTTHDKVKELTGYEMYLFRPPYGDYNDNLIKTVDEENYYCIQWDVDSLDWKDYGVEAIVQTVCEHKHLGNGSIILMHNGAKYTVDALDTIIKSLKAKGYEMVPISELIMTKDYKMNHEGRQISIGDKDVVN